MSDPSLRDQLIGILAPAVCRGGEGCTVCARAAEQADVVLAWLADWHPAAPSEPDVLAEAGAWLTGCVACDTGQSVPCTHPDGDVRAVLERLVEELSASRTTIARAVVARRRQEDELDELVRTNAALRDEVQRAGQSLLALYRAPVGDSAVGHAQIIQALALDANRQPATPLAEP